MDTVAMIVTRKLSSLKPHPQQDSLFPSLNDIELQALAADLQQHGLKYPVEILADGTIVCGHQRVTAAKLLGWNEIRCVVRHDLAAAGDAAVVEHLINDNLHRRQLSELDVARLVRQLRVLRTGKRTANGQGQWRDEIAKRFKVSGRTLSRWEQVLDAEQGVQAALRNRLVTLAQAIQIARLPKKDQRRIGAGLAAGRRLRDLMPTSRPSSSATAVRASREPAGNLVQRLDRLTKEFEAAQTPVPSSAAERRSLDALRAVLLHLLDELDDLQREAAPGSGEWLPISSTRTGKAKRPQTALV